MAFDAWLVLERPFSQPQLTAHSTPDHQLTVRWGGVSVSEDGGGAVVQAGAKKVGPCMGMGTMGSSLARPR